MPHSGDRQINAALGRFAQARAGARRFHAELLGRDVDPGHCFGDFLTRVARRDTAGIEKEYQTFRTKAALAEHSGVSGGYLVPKDLYADLLDDVSEQAIVRPNAMVLPMKTLTLDVPLPDATTAQAAGTSPFFGGLKPAFAVEGAARAESEPALRSVRLTAYDLTCYALSSNTLAQDAPGLEAWLRKLFASAIAWYEDYYFLNGTGLGQPVGLLKGAGVKTVTRETSSQFTILDAAKMCAALIPSSWTRALWTVSPTVWQYTARLSASGGAGFQTNQPLPDQPGAQYCINGIWGVTTEKTPAVGTQGDVALLDMGLYLIGDRGALEIAASDQEPTAYLKNQTVWRVTERVDGQPMLNSTVTLADASTTASAYVVLS